MVFGRPSVLVLAAICSLFTLSADTSSLAADVSPPPATAPMTGSLKATEGGADTASGVLDDLTRTKRLTWAPGPAYAGVSVNEVAATFRIEGAPAARLASVAVFEKLAAADPNLQRPPGVVLAAQGAEYRGVVEGLSYDCNSQRCEVKVTVLAGAGAATVKCPEDEWEWGPRR